MVVSGYQNATSIERQTAKALNSDPEGAKSQNNVNTKVRCDHC